MASISWPDLDLDADETVAFKRRANWSRRGIARGGTLLLTDRRLIFQPNSMEKGFGLAVAAWDRSAIAAVGVAGRTFSLLSGGLRRRLSVTVGGTQELFVIGDVDAVAEELRQLL